MGSFTVAAAFSSVMPLALRSSYRVAAYSAHFSLVAGSMISMPSREAPAATSLIFSGLPSSVSFARPCSTMMEAAFTVRGSSPSGSTMCITLDFAFALILSMIAIGFPSV